VGTATNHPLLFVTNDTERMNILAGGTGTFYNAFSIQGDDKSLIVRNAAGTVIGTMGAESSSTPNVGMTTIRNNGTTTIQFNSNGSSYINGGNVGIGTTSPATTLEVAGAITLDGAAAGGTSTYFDWRNNGSTFAYSGSHAAIVGGGGANNFVPGWCTGSNNLLFGTANTERMRITSGGEIGIGTTFVSAKVQIHSTNAGQPTIPLFIVNESTTVGTEARLGFAANTNNDVGSNRYSYISTINTSGSNGQDMIFATNPTGSAASERMRINSSGGVAIGTTTTQARLEVRHAVDASTTAPQFLIYGGASAYGAFHFLDSDAYHILTNSAARDIEIICDSGGVKLGPGDTSWSSNSDENLKENIKPLNNVLDKIKDYRCVEYNFKDDENEDKKIGFIAQDWQKDFSQVVNKNKQDVLSIKYTETIPVLLKAIQELEARVKELENK
jgi:hypothetical protein